VVPCGLGANAWYGLAENGPLARDVADAALMLSVLADRPDLATVAPPARPLRIAYSTRSPALGVGVDPAFARATREAASMLAARGHDVVEADPRYPLRYAVAIMAHWFAGPVADAEPLDASLLEPRTRRHLQLGRLALRLGLVREADRRAWQRLHSEFFAQYDALLTPALAATPIAAEGWRTRSWLDNVVANTRYAPFAASWNFAGFPAATLPLGFHEDGMPLSVQIVAATGRDARVLSIARTLEDGGPVGQQRPPSRPDPAAGIRTERTT
jgi:amidase